MDSDHRIDVKSSILENNGASVLFSREWWSYGGDSEFYFYAQTEEAAKKALKIRLQEKINKYQKVIEGL